MTTENTKGTKKAAARIVAAGVKAQDLNKYCECEQDGFDHKAGDCMNPPVRTVERNGKVLDVCDRCTYLPEGVELEKVLGKAALVADQQFGNAIGLNVAISSRAITVKIGKGFHAPEAAIRFTSKSLFSENRRVLSYEISHASGYKDSKSADQMAYILNGLACIARELESIGLEFDGVRMERMKKEREDARTNGLGNPRG